MRKRLSAVSSACSLAIVILFTAFALFLPVTESVAEEATGPLRVHAENPRYFTDGSGKAVYLTGSHVWNNLVDMGPSDPPPQFDFDAYLEWMEGLGHNFIRLWTWELVRWNTESISKEPKTHIVAPQPWARTGSGEALDGKPKYNLRQFNAEYFQRLRSRVAAAGKRGIYVSVMCFEGWSLQRIPGAWKSHPFNPENNVNAIDGDADGDGNGLEIHTLTDASLTALQEAYVKKVIDTVNDLDNVLYEISNENHPPSTAWQYHMIDFIHGYEKTKAKQHPVGMTFQFRGGSNKTLFESPADWVSPNREGGYGDNPPAADGKKVILVDTDHLCGIGGKGAWVWKSFCRGLNFIFMDPYDGRVLGNAFEPRWEPIQRNMGYTRAYADRMNLAAMTPRNALASTKYCLADSHGREWLVYAPSGGEFTVDLSGTTHTLAVEWFNPATGKEASGGRIAGGATQSFTPPFGGEAVLYLHAQTSDGPGAP